MKHKRPYIIAVDGYSSCGKSTFARMIARELSFLYIDSGAMYRSVALFCLDNNCCDNGSINITKLVKSLPLLHIAFGKNEKTGIQETYLNDRNVEDEIRSIRVSEVVSQLSKIKEVRQHLVKLQRNMAKNENKEIPGIVMDGRDIGTVVFPDAHLKIFMTADVDVRAKRRFDELRAKGMNVNYNDIRDNIIKRDHEDETRQESPLRKANDAYVLDNSNMTVDEQMVWFRKVWEKIVKEDYDN
jgi:cytidylate kinase